MKKINEDSLLPPLKEKWRGLLQALAGRESLLAGCSGGTDSSFLLYAAANALPGRVLAVTADHPLMKRSDLLSARETTQTLGVPWQALPMDVLGAPEIAQNTPDRCYFCKRMIFSALRELAEEKGLVCIADGSNADDAGEFRPGKRAALELGVWQPLFEAGLNKGEIRQLARAAGLANWNRPASGCLATRFPYHARLTPEALCAVEKGEALLAEAGFAAARLRHHGLICRIEVPKEQLPRLAKSAHGLIPPLRQLGFTYICADLEGFKSGSMDAELNRKGVVL
ncbi:MAG: ATP-dependent sacrificial sulfur transferase LarE [Clostridiales bacterium]|nr:ATP-dependent sacrificial sulfur transferase LarE [Clostridiales bacterium]